MRRGRSPCCEKQGMKKGPWTPEEDKLLVDYIQANGHGSWRSLPKLAGLERCGKSCRLRWTNYLRPDIKRGPFTDEEQKSIIQLHGIVGNKWSIIAGQLPGRTDNEIKNYWNTHIKKQLRSMGINPETHSPSTSRTTITPSSPSSFSAARHMAQWESARLEAEARLSRQSLLFLTTSTNSLSTTTTTTPATVNQTETKQEPDVILRIWNSEVGEAFRKAAVKTEDYSSSCNTKQSSALTDSERKEEVESSSNKMEENDEQFYLDLAGGDELSLCQSQLGSCCFSLFSTELGEASLDHDDPFK